jgi:CRP-like cAMP-binding protein
MRVRKDTIILDRRYVPEGAIIIEEGEMGTQAFLIQSGGVRVFTVHEGREIELARLGTGQIIGEMAMLSDGPRTASVQATEDCNLIVISRQQFQEKIKDTDPTIRAIVHMLTKRLIDGNAVLSDKKGDVDDLATSARLIYQNIVGGLPKNQQKTFQSTVLPPLEELLEAIEGFKDRYGSESDQ